MQIQVIIGNGTAMYLSGVVICRPRCCHHDCSIIRRKMFGFLESCPQTRLIWESRMQKVIEELQNSVLHLLHLPRKCGILDVLRLYRPQPPAAGLSLLYFAKTVMKSAIHALDSLMEVMVNMQNSVNDCRSSRQWLLRLSASYRQNSSYLPPSTPFLFSTHFRPWWWR
jgi:hypothetical protein